MLPKENLLKIAANSNISVLLQGESGSGKEVAARFIHGNSVRGEKPFVALNCGAIAPNLAESILEGSRKGAFSGAVSDQMGVVQAASGGTLFLDEIGEMPMEQQRKLLRILQERTVMPLGSTRSIPVDFRLICATNRNLRHEVAAGRFREDLFFRLNVFPIQLPPLRNREDFDEIAQELWTKLTAETFAGSAEEPNEMGSQSEARALTATELFYLRTQNWPGNIRQLKNVLQRYSLLVPYGVTLHEILEDEFNTHCSPSMPSLCEPQEFTRRRSKAPAQKIRIYNSAPRWFVIEQELDRNNWNKSLTAQKLGISRGSLNYQIKKHR